MRFANQQRVKSIRKARWGFKPYLFITDNLYICSVERTAIYNMIRTIVEGCLPGARVLLFGSRARGDNGPQSDYDLMIITPATLTQKDKLSWSSVIRKSIAKSFQVPVDLLLYSEQEILQNQDLPGHIVRSAIKEGIAL